MTRTTKKSVAKTLAGSTSVVHVDLRAGEIKPTMLRANPEELAKAKEYLGYRSNQEMVIDLIQNAVDEKAFRDQRVQAQGKALSLLDDLDLKELAEVTRFQPVERAREA